MKLLIITNLFPNSAEPTRGVYSLQQVLALARLADVTVVAPVPWCPLLPRLRRLSRWGTAAQIQPEEVIQGLRVLHPRYLAVPNIGRRYDADHFARGIRPTLARLLKERRVDAIFVTWAYPDVVGTVRLARPLGVPIIAGVLGSDVNVYAKGWRGRRIAEALARCRAVVCVSEALREKTAALGVRPELLHVVPNGVDLERFPVRSRAACREALGLPVARPLILFIGHLVPVKGPDILLEAVARLHRSAGGSERPLVVFVGEGEQAAPLARRARELGLAADVRFIGAVAHQHVSTWLGACDLLCVPSRQEGCPNVVLEALASGRPVVGARTGGIPELVREGPCGLLAPPGAPEALARALREALARRWDPAVIRGSVPGDWDANARTILRLCGAARDPLRGLAVLHVLSYSVPALSGYTQRGKAVVEGQRALGLRPIVLTSDRHSASRGHEDIDGVRYYRSRVPDSRLWRWLSRLPMGRDVALMLRLYQDIVRVARAERVMVIHAHSPALDGVPAIWAARRLRLPCVYEVRALWEDAAVDQRKTPEGGVRYRLSRALESYVVRRAAHVVAICEGLRRDMRSRGVPDTRLSVLPNGVDVRAFAPGGSPEEVRRRYGLDGQKVIGFIGSFFRFEGLRTLLEAVPLLRAAEPRVRVLLVGTGEEEADLRRFAREQQLDGAVLFAGAVPPRRVQAYYAAMDVLVYPRLSRRITELVTPLKPLEAMATGRPVVVSDVGGLRELIEDGATGLVFRAGEARDLAEKCLAVLADPTLAARLARAGRAFAVRERTWERVCQRSLQLYAELLLTREPR